MKPLHWRYEPETRDRYVRDQMPNEPIPPLTSMISCPDFMPPKTWAEWDGSLPWWDAVMLDRNRLHYDQNKREVPDEPVSINTVLLQLCKSYARKCGHVTRVIGRGGVYFWVHFHRIEPCWVMVTAKEQYKMLTEDELGVKHER